MMRDKNQVRAKPSSFAKTSGFFHFLRTTAREMQKIQIDNKISVGKCYPSDEETERAIFTPLEQEIEPLKTCVLSAVYPSSSHQHFAVAPDESKEENCTWNSKELGLFFFSLSLDIRLFF